MLLDAPNVCTTETMTVVGLDDGKKFQDTVGKPSQERINSVMLSLISRIKECYGNLPEFQYGDRVWEIKFCPDKDQSPISIAIVPVYEITDEYPITVKRNGVEYLYGPKNDAELRQIIPADAAAFKARWKADEGQFARSLPKSMCFHYGYPDGRFR